ncbi:MAG: M20/M25/M40 family metallo-hydrolase [Gemmatimonadota bacterium]|nr:M20/M25/M40 family metallo-hydrolase [Gemmatimonadota bacterium]
MESTLHGRLLAAATWALRTTIGCAAFVAAGSVPVAAQAATVPSDDPRMRAALQTIRDDNSWTLSQQVSLCEIPAPPFGEARRAAEYRRRLAALGLRNVRIDAEGNAIGERPGTGAGPTVVIAGHLDTVFPESTDVRTRRVGDRIYGPGIGDDCRGLAVVLAVARAFQRAGVRTNGTVIFVGNVGEEGPGNLRGVRHLYDKELKGRIDYFISVDGTGLGLTSRAVGSNRYRVTYKGPGGHSFGDFGMPSPIHALGRAISRIADLEVPAAPKTTFNVGIVRGGTSVNSIAFEASMDVDMRSESAQALGEVDVKVRRMLGEALNEENARAREAKGHLALVIDTIGIRPAGTQSDTSAIVRAAQSAAGALGFTVRPGASSTDANVPIGRGLPGIAIDGGGRGDGAHSLDEWYEDGAQGWLGPQWAALIVAALAGVR